MSVLDNAHAAQIIELMREAIRGEADGTTFQMPVEDARALIAEHERVTTETEWEYGCRDETDGYVASVGAPWMTREYAERVSANASSVIGVRRRKAGPWEPVHAGGSV